jgi:hypothetical protein
MMVVVYFWVEKVEEGGSFCLLVWDLQRLLRGAKDCALTCAHLRDSDWGHGAGYAT